MLYHTVEDMGNFFSLTRAGAVYMSLGECDRLYVSFPGRGQHIHISQLKTSYIIANYIVNQTLTLGSSSIL